MRDQVFTLPALRTAYAAGARPRDIIDAVLDRIAAADDPGIFIHCDPSTAFAAADALDPYDPARPLWGMPFAVKDNIDVAGMPTTAACPAFAYTPVEDAVVVARLRAAGAIPIGKTNLDQFATGLVGVRTPYPVPRNPLDPALVPGGSSSGSAVAVARGIVPFALGTDTAGSGRVPAALNNIVGLKPTLGAISNRGVVPACRTLDTVSVFALTIADTLTVLETAAAYDAADPFSKRLPPLRAAVPSGLKIGVPGPDGLAPCEPAAVEAFRAAVADLQAAGAPPHAGAAGAWRTDQRR
ncbi:MAG: amidase family protein, partial [Pseudomonadota bacterium]